MRKILQPLQPYQIPTIRLGQDTSREAVCLVFEKVNHVGGKKRDAFELLTAIFAGASEPLNLRDDWTARRDRICKGSKGQRIGMPVFNILRGIEFLQAVSLAVT